MISMTPQNVYTEAGHLSEGTFAFVPELKEDDRGSFMESFHQLEILPIMIRDNTSFTKLKNTFRGLHMQRYMSKLVRCVNGEALAVGVDLRNKSSTYGESVVKHLTPENRLQIFFPAGFAVGMSIMKDNTEFEYKCDKVFNPNEIVVIRYDSLGIDLPLEGKPIISEQDKRGITLADFMKSNADVI